MATKKIKKNVEEKAPLVKATAFNAAPATKAVKGKESTTPTEEKLDLILELKNITKTFLGGKIVANDDVSLSFARNEVHAIVGENGSGKSNVYKNIRFIKSFTNDLSSYILKEKSIYEEDKVGSIEIGKNPTFFISIGDALDMRTNDVTKAYINGVAIDLNNHQKELFEKYKNR